MAFISEWVMQIILFILIGTILELLIPNNGLKKYIHIVIGLLLLLILAKPILHIFQIDVTTELERMERAVFEDSNTLSESKSALENQKKDIQAEQDAYIWSEVKLQMMKEANPILNEQYATQVTDIQFSFAEEKMDKDDNLNEVTVILTTNEQDMTEKSVIQPIVIDTNDANKQEEQSSRISSKQMMEIRSKLEQIWGVNKEQIQLLWEGGAS